MNEFKLFKQIIKFGLVGVVNTAVDFGVLNALLFFMGATSGILYGIAKAISFLAAVVNSYFMNKYWTFRSVGKNAEAEWLKFLLISIGGFILNVGVAYFVVNFINPPSVVSSIIWANIAALFGTLSAFAWNFIGYKVLVFK